MKRELLNVPRFEAHEGCSIPVGAGREPLCRGCCLLLLLLLLPPPLESGHLTLIGR